MTKDALQINYGKSCQADVLSTVVVTLVVLGELLYGSINAKCGKFFVVGQCD